MVSFHFPGRALRRETGATCEDAVNTIVLEVSWDRFCQSIWVRISIYVPHVYFCCTICKYKSIMFASPTLQPRLCIPSSTTSSIPESVPYFSVHFLSSHFDWLFPLSMYAVRQDHGVVHDHESIHPREFRRTRLLSLYLTDSRSSTSEVPIKLSLRKRDCASDYKMLALRK